MMWNACSFDVFGFEKKYIPLLAEQIIEQQPANKHHRH